MKHLLLILFLIPVICSAQCETIKRNAIYWLAQRDTAVVLNQILSTRIDTLQSEIVSLRASDSLNRVALTHADSAIIRQGVLIEQYSGDAERWERKARRRLQIIGGMVVVVITLLLVG